MHADLEQVFLAHLSRHNNTADLAMTAARRALGGHRCAVTIAAQDLPTPAFARGLCASKAPMASGRNDQGRALRT